MAHLIDQAHKGTEAAFYGRQPAWHRLGTIVPEGVDTMEALRLAKADYTVREAPIHALTDAGIVESSTHKMTYRDHPDTGQPQQLGIVGDGYHVKQPRDTFAWLDSLMDSGVTVETAGVLREGRSIFVTCKLPEGVVLDPDGLADPLAQFVFLRDGYDGQLSFIGGITLVRIVCANTEAAALRNAKRTFRIQHRSGLEGNLQMAREALGVTFEYTQAITPVFEGMARTELAPAGWDQVLTEVLMPDPKAEKGEPSKQAVTQNADRRVVIDNLYKRDPAKGTVWGAFNAWTEYLDHERSERQEHARDTAVLEGTYDSDKSSVVRDLRKRFPNVDRVAAMSDLVAA